MAALKELYTRKESQKSPDNKSRKRMKTTATISQEELEQKAVDSMIAYEKSPHSGQE